ncbi:MAG: DeoR/GlpR transcriptional regulator [Selenomonadaceae bacterium]|nr:DeoR/GlpR transcriptional regulator [Selenomonadaceae bacterium]MBR6887129.1 DeoR/GlpR transcriptional regulator [Selenomonadaceae bacterium]
MRERQTQILNLLGEKKKITVLELSELLKVSDVTIRKDLSVLEEKGLLKREHGFATLPESDDVSTRLLFNYETKRRIAQKALESIKDGETLMIESGSCCALLAEEIVTNRRDVTIITNSVFIATFLRNKIGARIILLGGEFQCESQVMVGPLVKRCAENFSVEKFFMGTDGFNELGAMSGDLMRAEAVRNMAQSARRSIILTESKKFSQVGVVSLLSYREIDSIYTDEKISEATQKNLEGRGVQVILP